MLLIRPYELWRMFINRRSLQYWWVPHFSALLYEIRPARVDTRNNSHAYVLITNIFHFSILFRRLAAYAGLVFDKKFLHRSTSLVY